MLYILFRMAGRKLPSQTKCVYQHWNPAALNEKTSCHANTRLFFILDAALKASENVELVDTVAKIQQEEHCRKLHMHL